MERIPHDELARALGALHDRKSRPTQEAQPALSPAMTSLLGATSPGSGGPGAIVARALVDAARSLLGGAARAPAPSGYDEVRRGLVGYEHTLRDYSEKVGTFLDSVRRQDTAERQRQVSLPQITIRMTGPVEGATGGRFVVHNTRDVAARLSMRGGAFRSRDGVREAAPQLRLEPTDVDLTPSERRVVFLGVDFAGTGVGVGTVDGEVVVDVGGAESLRVAVEVELFSEGARVDAAR